MNSLLLLSLLACHSDDVGDPVDSTFVGELVTFTVTVENVGTPYPYIDVALPGDDSVNVPVDSQLTLVAINGDGELLASSPINCWDDDRNAVAPGAVELKELRIVEGAVQLRAAKSSAQVNSQAEGVGFSISAGEDVTLYGIGHHIGDGPAKDGVTPAEWLQAFVDGDVSGAESALTALVGVTHVAGAGYAASALNGEVLWAEGVADPGLGMEALAEDGDPLKIQAGAVDMVHDAAVFADMEGGGYEPLMPGSQASFNLDATTGEVMHIATMLAQSNDLFLGSPAAGIPLFDDNGDPITGEIQDQMLLWNLGSEVDQDPGMGPDQAPRQVAGNTGADDEVDYVRLVENEMYPAAGDVIRVTVAIAE